MPMEKITRLHGVSILAIRRRAAATIFFGQQTSFFVSRSPLFFYPHLARFFHLYHPMEIRPITSAGGLHLVAHYAGHVLTKADVMLVCRQLEKLFGDGYSFTPDPTCYGGILMRTWPGRVAGAYKSFRLYPGSMNRIWPHVDLDDLSSWHDSEEVIFSPQPEICERGSKKLRLGVMLKAHHWAPVWTRKEILHFKEAFATIGLKLGGRIPTKDELTLHDCAETGRKRKPEHPTDQTVPLEKKKKTTTSEV